MSTESTGAADLGETTAIEFYFRPGCPFCSALRRPLRRNGLPAREINIWDDPAAAARVRSVANGNETVPTVFIGKHALVNPSYRELDAAVRKYAPELLEQTEPAESRPKRALWPFRRRS
ncbi:glutaredoxin family protein [Amycolatopsis palatopharyngis]|uniref:glutaredoxin family protein n=1 Tax=Amycolatopsis palatopharyngis TaxID=187982 RepID=UPI000E2250D6|nr:glutaredoxin domain-containing protein [Amycolatopsis palatopharyngis]